MRFRSAACSSLVRFRSKLWGLCRFYPLIGADGYILGIFRISPCARPRAFHLRMQNAIERTLATLMTVQWPDNQEGVDSAIGELDRCAEYYWCRGVDPLQVLLTLELATVTRFPEKVANEAVRRALSERIALFGGAYHWTRVHGLHAAASPFLKPGPAQND